ncbi:ER degradation-enhancing alpha-mannosidase-like protein 1 [Diplogelasinospora grovesii]|uniref:alpha-1,2-Mannosidase n=1 Tax=Diplogelasinospora grovesii TaxID=303347 RepID=A0AAN6S6Z9_9PEZI|nr:ER degradation-enhancing alpha-mannosidase-like protein 1 [Diplogelasinospora grovesii]
MDHCFSDDAGSRPRARSPKRPPLSGFCAGQRNWRSSWIWLIALVFLVQWPPAAEAMRPSRVKELRQETVEMFYHGFDNYMKIAFPEDELRPVSCTPLTRDAKNPRNVEINDVLGNYSLTLIDSLSTLAILASAPPDGRNTGPRALKDFQDGVAALVEQYGDGRPGPSGKGLRGRGFDLDSKVQVFETVIRGVGGLLSAHLFAIGALPITGYEPRRPGEDPLDVDSRPIAWPNGLRYDGQLLRLALDLAQRLLPAFYTKTGMPYPRVNLRHGIPFYTNSPLHESSPPAAGTDGSPEITETCSAGAGSLVLEFTVLSRLAGDPRFEQLAKRAFWAVWYRKSNIGLIGAGVDAEHGHWIGAYSVIGAGADSFFEYALKSHILLSGHELPNRTLVLPKLDGNWLDPNSLFPPLSDAENSPDTFLEAWHHAHAAIKRHLYSEKDHPHYENVNLWTGSLASNWVDSLGAYYSGLLVLAGEVDEAIETNFLYTAIWTRYAALPERWSIKDKTVEGGLGWWPLRPEFIESTYHLYRATKDPWYLYVGEMVQRDITRRCWTPCGWAGLQNVLDGEKSDRMESFFLGETAKYMYLLFDDAHPLNSLDAAYVFTTEGHPLIIPKTTRTSKGVKTRRKVSDRKDLAVHFDETYTNSCPAPPATTPITGSINAARDDIYHAARMLDLHLVSNTRPSLDGGDADVTGQATAKSNFTLFPWTLPPEMLPDNGTCSKVYQPVEVTLEFASNTQQVVGGGGSAFNFMLGSQNMERLSANRIRVASLSGLKVTMRLEDYEAGADREWRVTKANGVPLGRDESIVLDRSILGEVSDPRFNLVRDPVVVRLQHLHRVEILQQEETVYEEPITSSQLEYVTDIDEAENNSNTKDHSTTLPVIPEQLGFGSLVKSLLSRMATAVPSLQAPESIRTLIPDMPGSIPSPSSAGYAFYNLLINQTAVTAAGIGAAPLPAVEMPAGTRIPEYGPVPNNGVLPWTTIYAASGDVCSEPLPETAARDHQVMIIRRGGCSFSTKLGNIPAYKPDSKSLQLVIIVSDEGEDEVNGGVKDDYSAFAGSGLVRPLLDEVQRTPAGIQRRNPIAMIMVGGGDTTFHQLAMAERIGLTRRYYIESNGSRVGNIVVDEGDIRNTL